jgi:hypothetical protein
MRSQSPPRRARTRCRTSRPWVFVPGYEASGWFGIGAPKGTPAEIVDKLNRQINAGLAHPKIKARLADLGGTPLVSSPAVAALTEFDPPAVFGSVHATCLSPLVTDRAMQAWYQSLHCMNDPQLEGSHGKPHRTTKILSHVRRRSGLTGFLRHWASMCRRRCSPAPTR